MTIRDEIEDISYGYIIKDMIRLGKELEIKEKEDQFEM